MQRPPSHRTLSCVAHSTTASSHSTRAAASVMSDTFAWFTGAAHVHWPAPANTHEPAESQARAVSTISANSSRLMASLHAINTNIVAHNRRSDNARTPY